MGQAGTAGYAQLGLFVVMAVALYLLIVRPQQQRQREHDELVRGLARGDRVITAGGVIGLITDVRDEDVSVQVAEGVEMRFVKDAVIRRIEE